MKKLSAAYGKHLALISASNNEESNQQQKTISAFGEEIFNQDLFMTCDLIGNYQNAFMIIHSNGSLYLVDQHAASEKSLYVQLLNRNNLFPVKYSGPCLDIENIYDEVLTEKKEKLEKLGWVYNVKSRGKIFITVQLQMVPSLIGKNSTPEDFLQIISQMYTSQVQEYSQSQKQSLASTACHSAYRIGHQLEHGQMRGLLDSLGLMDGAFNCPHGRPTIICLGRISQYLKNFDQPEIFSLD